MRYCFLYISSADLHYLVLSQTPAYNARPPIYASVSHDLPVYSPNFRWVLIMHTHRGSLCRSWYVCVCVAGCCCGTATAAATATSLTCPTTNRTGRASSTKRPKRVGRGRRLCLTNSPSLLSESLALTTLPTRYNQPADCG